MKQTRDSAGALAQCLQAFADGDEFSDPVDRDAFVVWLGETLHLWRHRLTKG